MQGKGWWTNSVVVHAFSNFGVLGASALTMYLLVPVADLRPALVNVVEGMWGVFAFIAALIIGSFVWMNQYEDSSRRTILAHVAHSFATAGVLLFFGMVTLKGMLAGL